MAHLKKIQIARFEPESSGVGTSVTSGQSYEASAIVIYESRGEPDLKIPHNALNCNYKNVCQSRPQAAA